MVVPLVPVIAAELKTGATVSAGCVELLVTGLPENASTANPPLDMDSLADGAYAAVTVVPLGIVGAHPENTSGEANQFATIEHWTEAPLEVNVHELVTALLTLFMALLRVTEIEVPELDTTPDTYAGGP